MVLGHEEKYPVVITKYHDVSKEINPYVFTEILFEKLEKTDMIVSSILPSIDEMSPFCLKMNIA